LWIEGRKVDGAVVDFGLSGKISGGKISSYENEWFTMGSEIGQQKILLVCGLKSSI
jgi:hypothetical protein